ncbi:four helix bundle protein [Dehalogenimonas formicexedens]|uniref:Four helix bundle protein n=1 Tax=Dehalogenimonas formicexedens TaxID=1839801 RepID=A0A1P8FAL0_9CHLR|nr:four helix bundle protein [Dehalogenimonas formicexedens]APV45480.1 four helix bundle protein [Dehalogenimonas formicexedens]
MEKKYDLEQRTEAFAAAVIEASRRLPKDPAINELVRQVVRAAGSIGANYIEANESLSKKDLAVRIKICRKEAKECRYWLSLIKPTGENLETQFSALIQESTELMNIFGAILRKVSDSDV